jgi:probable rRNA maturation factor
VIEVIVEDKAWRGAEPRAAVLARRAAAAALASERRKGADLAILLTDDAGLANLNARFRGKAGPTNVLSFPSSGASQGRLGDIALAYGVCAGEAAEQDKPLAHHLQHLAAHGVLHLLGYDHESEAEAVIMEAKERAILAGLGVPDPYAEHGAQGDHG